MAMVSDTPLLPRPHMHIYGMLPLSKKDIVSEIPPFPCPLIPTYGIMWHGVTNSLTHAHFPNTLRAISAITFNTQSHLVLLFSRRFCKMTWNAVSPSNNKPSIFVPHNMLLPSFFLLIPSLFSFPSFFPSFLSLNIFLCLVGMARFSRRLF